MIEPQAGAAPRKLTEFFAPNKPALEWTPDGTRLLYTTGLEPRLNAYIQDRLSVFSLADGKSRLLTERLDRALMGISAASNDSVEAIVEDDGVELPVSVRLDTGETQRLATGKWSTVSICSAGKRVAVVASNDSSVPEVYAVEPAGLRKLTHHNDAEIAELALGARRGHFLSKPRRHAHSRHDGQARGLSRRTSLSHASCGFTADRTGRTRTDSRIDAYSPELERQLFAAHGYVVLAVNYRGSSGRGAAFAQAIAADWGHKEVEDLLGAASIMLLREGSPIRSGSASAAGATAAS